MNWVIGILIDIILVAIVLIGYKIGKKDGFAKTLVSLLGFVIAILSATVLCKPVANFVYSNTVQKPVEAAVSSAIEQNLNSTVSSSKQQIAVAIDKTIEGLPAFVRDVTGLENKKDDLVDSISELDIKLDGEVGIELTKQYIQPLVVNFLSIIAFILLFAVVYLICKILAKSLKLVNKIPLLGRVNALLGGILGIVKGIVIAAVICFALNIAVTNAIDVLGIINAQTVESSFILKTVSTYNPLNLVLDSITVVE